MSSGRGAVRFCPLPGPLYFLGDFFIPSRLRLLSYKSNTPRLLLGLPAGCLPDEDERGKDGPDGDARGVSDPEDW